MSSHIKGHGNIFWLTDCVLFIHYPLLKSSHTMYQDKHIFFGKSTNKQKMEGIFFSTVMHAVSLNWLRRMSPNILNIMCMDADYGHRRLVNILCVLRFCYSFASVLFFFYLFITCTTSNSQKKRVWNCDR